MSDEFITPKDVQERLGLGRNSVYKLIGLKGFPKIIIGKKILIPKEEFDKYIYKHIGTKIILD